MFPFIGFKKVYQPKSTIFSCAKVMYAWMFRKAWNGSISRGSINETSVASNEKFISVVQ